MELHFPCHLWIEKKQKYHLYLHNSCLPQLDSIPGRRLCREEEIKKRKILYAYEDEITGFPRRVSMDAVDLRLQQKGFLTGNTLGTRKHKSTQNQGSKMIDDSKKKNVNCTNVH